MSISLHEMDKTVAQLIARGKGILAADESVGTLAKRFKEVKVVSTADTQRDYRELLFSTPGLGDFMSGVILFEETLKQKSAAGVPLAELLKAQGIVPGIKVDKGTLPLPAFPGETLTQGLDGLAQRLSEYKQLGARFAKWRYAVLCQEQGVVPIVEPEVLMQGEHTLATSARITDMTLNGQPLQADKSYKVARWGVGSSQSASRADMGRR